MEELLNFPTNLVWFRHSGKEWNVLIKSTESSKINGLHKQSDNQFNLNGKRHTSKISGAKISLKESAQTIVNNSYCDSFLRNCKKCLNILLVREKIS